ncbi:MAG: imidazolonepropionase [Pseudomonadota bacterium]
MDYLISNVNLAGFGQASASYGHIPEAVVAIQDNRIAFAGSQDEFEQEQNTVIKKQLDANGAWMTPGLIDCHTHLVFGGNRAEEFEWRLQGESYEHIARRGGGIVSTVNHTRALSEEELYQQSAPRLRRLLEEGVTTVEIKSGYGLDAENEIKMLRVARALEADHPVTIKTTFLGAHAVPVEYQQQEQGQQAYIDFVCEEMLPEVANLQLADAVDVFCEGIGFTPQQCEQVFQVAQGLGLPVKGHVEQLSDLKGAVLASQYDCLSVDHIEYLAEEDVGALTDTVAVLLPAAFYCLNETQKPPIRALRDHHIPMAVATDLNPGTAPLASLLTAMNQTCVLFGLTPEEALRGATQHAAQALGISSKGQIIAGMDADLLLWDIQHPAELAYGVNFHRPSHIWQNGRLCGGSHGDA